VNSESFLRGKQGCPGGGRMVLAAAVAPFQAARRSQDAGICPVYSLQEPPSCGKHWGSSGSLKPSEGMDGVEQVRQLLCLLWEKL